MCTANHVVSYLCFVRSEVPLMSLTLCHLHQFIYSKCLCVNDLRQDLWPSLFAFTAQAPRPGNWIVSCIQTAWSVVADCSHTILGTPLRYFIEYCSLIISESIHFCFHILLHKMCRVKWRPLWSLLFVNLCKICAKNDFHISAHSDLDF